MHSKTKLWFATATLLLPSFGMADSFDCAKAQTDVERLICDIQELRRLDRMLNVYYAEAKSQVDDPEGLRDAQRAWLGERDKCGELAERIEIYRCLRNRYDRRVDELRVLAAGHKLWDPPPAMTPEQIEQTYVHERREKLRAFFQSRPIGLAVEQHKKDPLCRDFMTEFTAQTEAVELIPPTVVAHDYRDPALVDEIFLNCPDLELRTPKIGVAGPYVGPRNFLLYSVDIDNDPNTGQELLLLEEAMWMEEPKFGPQIMVQDRFRLLDLKNCTTKGFSGVSASRRFPANFDVSGESPQTGLHGVVRYKGNSYLYYVVEHDPKSTPLGLLEYDEAATGKFRLRCVYHNTRGINQ